MESTVQHQPTRATEPLVACSVAASAGFGVVYFGLPLLGAIEQGPSIRIGIAVVVALFVGSSAALVARGRSGAAAANAVLAAEAPPPLIRHRALRRRARRFGSLAFLVSTGLAYLALGEIYTSLNEDRYEWDQLAMGHLELGVSVVIATMIGFVVWRILHPGRYFGGEDEHVLVGDVASTVSDDDLEKAAAAVRAHQTRSLLAMAVGLVAAVATMTVLGYGIVTFDVDGDAFAWMVAFGLGIAAGVVVNRAVSPTMNIEDIDTPPIELPAGEGVEPPTFAERLANAESLQISRRSGPLRFLGLEGARSYQVSADHIALADGTETQTLPARLLPASLAPYRAEISGDDSVEMRIEADPFSTRFTVRAGSETVGTIEGAIFGRRYEVRAGDATLTIEGSFFNRKELALLSSGERVGYVQVQRSQSTLESLLSGSEVCLHLELPSGTPVALRRVLLAALLVVDHRHF